MTLELIAGMRALAPSFDGFIVDLWGVLHDGAAPYPGAVDCLTRLKRAGKRLVLLSNAPRPAAPVIVRLTELGFPRDSYDAVMTSGEETWQHLVRRDDPFYAALGERCYMLGPARDNGLLEGVRAVRVADLDDADFILNTGADYGETVEDYAALLGRAAARRMPMVCANPDLVVRHRGKLEICAGALAQHYETLGGPVRYHGKPHASVYRSCFELLAPVAPELVCAIGDSLRTDVAGGIAAGIETAFVAGGIHAEAMAEAMPTAASFDALCRAQGGPVPHYVIPAFTW